MSRRPARSYRDRRRCISLPPLTLLPATKSRHSYSIMPHHVAAAPASGLRLGFCSSSALDRADEIAAIYLSRAASGSRRPD